MYVYVYVYVWTCIYVLYIGTSSKPLLSSVVRHINYNDFLPLMPERDLNYRYLLYAGVLERGMEWSGRGGSGRGREEEREDEKGAPFDSLRDYRVPSSISGIKLRVITLGSWVNLYPSSYHHPPRRPTPPLRYDLRKSYTTINRYSRKAGYASPKRWGPGHCSIGNDIVSIRSTKMDMNMEDGSTMDFN